MYFVPKYIFMILTHYIRKLNFKYKKYNIYYEAMTL